MAQQSVVRSRHWRSQWHPNFKTRSGSRLLTAPVGDVHFHGVATTEAVDDWLEGDGERTVRGHEVVFPIAAAECHAANRDAVLLEAHRKVMARCANAARRL